MTTTYERKHIAPEGGWTPNHRDELQTLVSAEGLTHVETTKGDILALRTNTNLNVKSLPLAEESPRTLPYKRAKSLGVLTVSNKAHSDSDSDSDVSDAAAGTSVEIATPHHAERQHAILSASGAHRWLNCPPSALKEADLPDQLSPYAAQGTAAHEVAEWRLHNHFAPIGDHMPYPKTAEQWHDPEMGEMVGKYVNHVIETAKQDPTSQVFIEQRLDLTQWVPDGFGTGDAIIITDTTLHLLDLKYGQGVKIDATENPQLMLYGCGAIAAFGMLYDFTNVKLTIVQPRLNHISTWEIRRDDLIKWAETEVKPVAEIAIKGEGQYHAGDWCRFCKLAPTCSTRGNAAMEVANQTFALSKPAELTEEQITMVLEKGPELTKWVKDVQDYALKQATTKNQHYRGFKLVAGRSNRRWGATDSVVEAAYNAGLTDEDIFDQKLKGIPAMEKKLGTDRFQTTFGDLVVKPEGKPTLVPESDKRPEINTFEPIPGIASKKESA